MMSLKLEELLHKSNKVVFFTGAGISTNSGIPDFRGPKGVWKTSTPIYFQDFISSKEKRIESWKRKFGNELNIQSAKPNEGHRKIAKIMRIKESFLITQNVDNLHQDSGVDEKKISELHGNATFANPNNQVAGQHGVFRILQDGTGGRTLAFGNNMKFPGGTAPTLSTAASAQDLLAYYVAASGTIYAQVILDLK